MTSLKTKDYIGFSKSSIDEALYDALQNAGEPSHFEVIETRSSSRSRYSDNKNYYQVTLTTSFNC